MAELFNDSSLFGSSSSSNNAPIEVFAEMLDYDYVNECNSIDELKAILRCLETGKFGKYPHLENTVKNKLDKLSNTEQKKKVQVISSSAANDKECGEKDSLQDWLVQCSQGSADKVNTTTLPPVRAVTNTNLANVEVKPKVAVKKSNPPPPKTTTKKAASTSTTEVFRKEKLSTKEYFDRWDKFDVDKALAAIDDSDEEEEEVQPKKSQVVVEPKVVEKPKVVETDIVAEPKVVVEKETPSPTKQFHRMAITEVDDAVADEDEEIEEVYTPGAAALEKSTQPSSAPSKVVKDNNSPAIDSHTSNTIPNDTTTKASDSSWQKISIVETSDSDEEVVDNPTTASSSSMRRVDIVEETLTDNELDSDKFKSEGNTAMNEKRYSDAVRFYTLALDTNPDNTLALANRSAAYIKLEDWGNAIIDSTIVLSLESNNTKLLYRRGLANMKLGNTEESLVDFEHALSCQPSKDQRKLLKKKVTACKKMLASMKDEMKEEVVGGVEESNSAGKKTKKKSRNSQALAF